MSKDIDELIERLHSRKKQLANLIDVYGDSEAGRVFVDIRTDCNPIIITLKSLQEDNKALRDAAGERYQAVKDEKEAWQHALTFRAENEKLRKCLRSVVGCRTDANLKQARKLIGDNDE